MDVMNGLICFLMILRIITVFYMINKTESLIAFLFINIFPFTHVWCEIDNKRFDLNLEKGKEHNLKRSKVISILLIVTDLTILVLFINSLIQNGI